MDSLTPDRPRPVNLLAIMLGTMLVISLGALWFTRKLMGIEQLKPEVTAVVDAGVMSTTRVERTGMGRGYTFIVATIQHDGHWFVATNAGGIIHHPDCPKEKFQRP